MELAVSDNYENDYLIMIFTLKKGGIDRSITSHRYRE